MKPCFKALVKRSLSNKHMWLKIPWSSGLWHVYLGGAEVIFAYIDINVHVHISKSRRRRCIVEYMDPFVLNGQYHGCRWLGRIELGHEYLLPGGFRVYPMNVKRSLYIGIYYSIKWSTPMYRETHRNVKSAFNQRAIYRSSSQGQAFRRQIVFILITWRPCCLFTYPNGIASIAIRDIKKEAISFVVNHWSY